MDTLEISQVFSDGLLLRQGNNTIALDDEDMDRLMEAIRHLRDKQRGKQKANQAERQQALINEAEMLTMSLEDFYQEAWREYCASGDAGCHEYMTKCARAHMYALRRYRRRQQAAEEK